MFKKKYNKKGIYKYREYELEMTECETELKKNLTQVQFEKEELEDAGKNPISIFDLIQKYFSKNALSIFIKPPSLEELSKRLKKRNTESTQSLKTRLEKSNNEMNYLSKYDQIIENDNLDIASQKIREIVKTFLEN